MFLSVVLSLTRAFRVRVFFIYFYHAGYGWSQAYGRKPKLI